jgi:transglutaminase-like putative cysteine protease
MMPTMPLLTIHHKTEYRYTRAVAFGEHRIMLRPRDGHDLRVLSGGLSIVPQPMSLRWIHDVFGNSVAIATFDERAKRLTFVSTATVEHNPAEEFALTPDDPAYFYPFRYGHDEFPDLVQFITPQYDDPDGQMNAWALRFLDAEGPTPTCKILSEMTHGIRKSFLYRKRHERGTQHPLETLRKKSGTCRDYALFMIEALRRLGLAARFVSGYLFIDRDPAHRHVGGGSTHAWVQVYLPSAGWIEFDPTNGIIGNRDLVRVAVARDPRQAIPLHGTYLGTADAFIGMEVSINVVAAGEVAKTAEVMPAGAKPAKGKPSRVKPSRVKHPYVKSEASKAAAVAAAKAMPELVEPELVEPELAEPELVVPELAQPELVVPELAKPADPAVTKALARQHSVPDRA